MRSLEICLYSILYLFLSSCPIFGEKDQSKWVDPHDMSPVYDKEYFPYDIDVPNFEKNCVFQTIEGPSKAYLKRVVNMILNAVYEDSFNENLYKGHIIFEMDFNKFSKLHEFANNADSSDRYLQQIDLILSEIIKRPSHDFLKEYFSSWFAKIFKIISSRSGIFGICTLTYVFVVYKMLKGNFNYWVIFKFLFINVVLFDFAFVWIRLYQKVEIDKMADSAKFKNAPDYCNPQNMNSMQYIASLLSSVDQCKEYHHVTLTDIFWTVSPGSVVTEMVTKGITEPMKAIGPAVGQFVYGIYGSLPFPFNIILLPLVLVFVMIMSCISLSFLLNIPIKFNFFHLISFSFGDNPGQRNIENGNVLTGQTVEKLLDIVKENNTNPNRYIEESKPLSNQSNNPIITKELIRQISENLSQITLKNTDETPSSSTSKNKETSLTNSAKAILGKQKSTLEETQVQSGISDEDNILKKSDFVERLKEILETPNIDSEMEKTASKIELEPNLTKEGNLEVSLGKRKRPDGAGDF